MAYTIEFEGFQQYDGITTSGSGMTTRWVNSGPQTGAHLELGWQGSLFRYLDMHSNSSGAANFCRLISENPQPKGVIGFRFQYYGNVGGGETRTLIRISPVGTSVHVIALTIATSGLIEVVINGVTHETSGRLFQNEWHFMEFEWESGPLGFVKMYMNGENILDVAGFGSDPLLAIESFMCWSTYQNRNYRVSDIYMKMGETGRLGDCRVYYTPVNADDTVEWTPLTGSDNYAMINELPIDTDSTYNATETLNAQDTFTVTPLSFVPERIHAVGILGVGKKSDVADRAVEYFLLANGQDAIRNEKYLATTYTQSYGFATENPDTDAEFVPEDWDNLRVGYKLTV